MWHSVTCTFVNRTDLYSRHMELTKVPISYNQLLSKYMGDVRNLRRLSCLDCIAEAKRRRPE